MCCPPPNVTYYPLPAQAEDPTARLLREKYGIAKPYADEDEDDGKPTPCSPATRAGMGEGQ